MPETESSAAVPPLTAVILAGGDSRRFGGADKALLQWQGSAFIERIIDRIAPQATTILINSNRASSYPAVKLTVVPDPWPERRGPLAGVLAGLEAASNDWVLFIPCDCPTPAADLAQRLWRAIDSNIDLAYAGVGDDNHYLFCLMRRCLRDDLRSYLQRGGSAVRQWMATQRSCRVAFDDEADCFLNINSAEELDAHRQRD